ncbi:MAG: ribonuclease H-like domain-containing protein [Candidatus Methanoperedens sp.]|nr:ribonuclease H-like domain-containing protein [Candidatus Methanoperedens sp.]
MLENTYIHVPGIGGTVERKIWESGIRNWEDFLENHHQVRIPTAKKRVLVAGIGESVEQLSSGNHVFFLNSIPGRHHWRAYRYFKGDTAYVDIETTGLSPNYHEITIIGIYDGKEAKMFIKGINLADAVDELSKYKQLVTFNGARFDLPFIESEYPGFFNHLHTDLMYPLRKIGYSGGLKNIECMLGLKRSGDTVGISGFDAVRLWKKYERGDKKALELLVKYNTEDIVNLETIMDMTYPVMLEKEMGK